MARKEEVVNALFNSALTSWKRYEEARKKGNLEAMRVEFNKVVKVLRVLYLHGCRERIDAFLRKEGMPVKAIMKKIRK